MKVLQKFILFFILLEKDKFIQMKLDFYEIFTIQIKNIIKKHTLFIIYIKIYEKLCI